MVDRGSGGGWGLDRRTLLRLAGGGLVLAVAGCTGTEETPVTDRVPSGAPFMVGVDGDVDEDRETRRVVELLADGEPPGDLFGDRTGLDFGRVSRLVLFGLATPGELSPAEADGTVVHGDFDEEEVVAGFSAASGVSFTETEYGGRRLYTVRPGQREADALAHVGNGNFVFGSQRTVMAMLDVRTGDAEPVSGPVLDAYEGVRRSALLRFGIEVPDQPPGELPDETVDVLETVAGGYYTPRDGVGVTVAFEAVSAAAATDFEAQLTSLLGELAADGGPLAEALVRVEVERQGEVVGLTYESSLAEFEALVEALREGAGPGPTPVPGDDVVNRRTGSSFGSIQSAIDDDDTLDGDVLLVSDRPRPYTESVDVTKAVDLRGDPTATLDGEGSLGRGVGVMAPGASLTDLTIRNYANESIQVFSGDVRVSGVTVEGGSYGLYAESVSDLQLQEVTVTGTEWMGVDLNGVSGLEVRGLTAATNAQYGLSMNDCTGVTVENAVLTENGAGGLVRGTTDCAMSGIDATGNRSVGLQAVDAIGLAVSDAVLSGHPEGAGLFLANVTDVRCQDVTATENGWPVTLLAGSNVGFAGLTARDNEFGVDLVDASKLTVTESSVVDNGYGVFVARRDGDPVTVVVDFSDIAGNDAYGLTLEGEPEPEDSPTGLLRTAELERLGAVRSESLPAVTTALLADYAARREAGTPGRSAGVLQATGNWWGAASGPGGVGPGDGDPVYGDVTYEPWSTEPGPDWNTDGRR